MLQICMRACVCINTNSNCYTLIIMTLLYTCTCNWSAHGELTSTKSKAIDNACILINHPALGLTSCVKEPSTTLVQDQQGTCQACVRHSLRHCSRHAKSITKQIFIVKYKIFCTLPTFMNATILQTIQHQSYHKIHKHGLLGNDKNASNMQIILLPSSG